MAQITASAEDILGVSGDFLTKTTQWAQTTRIDPVFGNEESTYRRLIYGTDTQRGIPSGPFYDTRAMPLPYMPTTCTPLWFWFDSANQDQEHTVVVTRETPTEFVNKTTKFTVTPTEHTMAQVIAVQLGQGLNTLDVMIGGEVIYTQVFTSTVYALFLHTLAKEIHFNVNEPLDDLDNALFSANSTRLMEVYLGAVTSMFPEDTVAHRMVTQLVLSGIMNNAGSTAGILDIGSMSSSTPKLVQRDTVASLQDAWIAPVRSFADRIDAVLLVWGQYAAQGRALGFHRLLAARGVDVDVEETLVGYSHVTDSLHAARHELFLDLDDSRDTEEWAEIEVQSVLQLIPEAGAYVIPCIVSVSADPYTAVYYTLDGTVPTTSSPLWPGDMPLLHTQTVSVLGVKAGEPDQILTHRYAVVYPDPTQDNSVLTHDTSTFAYGYGWSSGVPEDAPVFSPLPGLFNASTSVTLSASPGRVVHYTVDGSAPTASSPEYTSPIPVSRTNDRIRAVSFPRGGGAVSSEADGHFRVLPVTALPNSAIVNDTITVALSAPAGYSIYYSLSPNEVFATDHLYTGPLTFTASSWLSAAVVTPEGETAPTTHFEYTVVTTPILYPLPGKYVRYPDTSIDILSDALVTTTEPLVAYTENGTNPGLTSTKTSAVSPVPEHRVAPTKDGAYKFLARAMAATVMSPVVGGNYTYSTASLMCCDVHWFNPVTHRYGYIGYKATEADTTFGWCEITSAQAHAVDTSDATNNVHRFDYGSYVNYAGANAASGVFASTEVVMFVRVNPVTGLVYVATSRDIGNSMAIPQYQVRSINTVTGAVITNWISTPEGVINNVGYLSYNYEVPLDICYNPESGTMILSTCKNVKGGSVLGTSSGGLTTFRFLSIVANASNAWGPAEWTYSTEGDAGVVNRWECMGMFVRNGMLYGVFNGYSVTNYSGEYAMVISRIQASGLTDVTTAGAEWSRAFRPGTVDTYPARRISVACDPNGTLWFHGGMYENNSSTGESYTLDLATYAPNHVQAYPTRYYSQGSRILFRVAPTWDTYQIACVHGGPNQTTVTPFPLYDWDHNTAGGCTFIDTDNNRVIAYGFRSGIVASGTLGNASASFPVY